MDIAASLCRYTQFRYELSPLMIQLLIIHARSPCACVNSNAKGKEAIICIGTMICTYGKRSLKADTYWNVIIIATCGHADLYHCIPSVNLAVMPGDFCYTVSVSVH